MRQRIYIDTSVLGGYYDIEFENDTKLFFKRIEKKDFNVHLSEISDFELLEAPQRVRDVVNRIPKDCLFRLELTKEAEDLANQYVSEKILNESSFDDAYHIAISTVNRIDVLVSWNFKHIVNYNKILLFNAVNLKLGYPTIDIRSPKELIIYEDE